MFTGLVVEEEEVEFDETGAVTLSVAVVVAMAVVVAVPVVVVLIDDGVLILTSTFPSFFVLLRLVLPAVVAESVASRAVVVVTASRVVLFPMLRLGLVDAEDAVVVSLLVLGMILVSFFLDDNG